ncbi:MAG: AMP-binding protein [Eubacterium sp.]|nr:AMP-binding protein [Eubacterium sp.]
MDIMINPLQQKKYEEQGLWSDQTLLDYWNLAVSRYADKEYIVDDLGKRLTYRAVDEKADILAAYMTDQGIGTGDMVTLQCTPRSEFILICIACFKIGAIVVPIKMRTGAAEWISLMNRIGSRMHFAVHKYHGDDICDFINKYKNEVRKNVTYIYIGGERHGEEEKQFEDILKGKKTALKKPECNANEIAVILFTSGTTKGSKGVLLTHNNVISSEKIFNECLHLTSEDIMFMPAPLSHATGFHHGVIAAMLAGGKLVLMEQYNAAGALDIMDEEHCTFSMGATPFIFDYLKHMDLGHKKPSSLQFYVCGGAPVSYELTRSAWENHHLLVCECYGSTESVPHVLVPPERAMELKGKWSGKTMGAIEIRVVDEKGNDVPPGTVGEEISRGPNVFVGYLDDPDSTKEALDEDGWFHSGDLCYGNEEGYIKISGRKKDIIVRGGENLNINEIEESMLGCPGVYKTGVVGMRDARLGERVCAFVINDNSGIVPTVSSIGKYLASKKVSKWLWPEHIEFIDRLPYTDSGKLKRYELVKELERRLKGKE